jgi:hypothetical protein
LALLSQALGELIEIARRIGGLTVAIVRRGHSLPP